MKKALVVIDVQREYSTPGRPFFLKGIDSSLENIRKILKGARQAEIPVIHVQHLQEGRYFRLTKSTQNSSKDLSRSPEKVRSLRLIFPVFQVMSFAPKWKHWPTMKLLWWDITRSCVVSRRSLTGIIGVLK